MTSNPAMRTSHLLLIAIAATVFAIAAAAMPGGWEAIPNITDPHVQELGSWAVAEHTKATNERLTFVKVVSGKQQVVSGMNYRLIIETANGPTSNSMYDAVVYEQSSTKKRKLMSFTQARN
jgi:hypothetical protein